MHDTVSTFPRPNEPAPDFTAKTTHGDRTLSDDKDKWPILFSHPAEFDLYAKGSAPREALKDWHFMLGLTVPVLVALRLLNRLVGGNPAVISPLPRWQHRLASAAHVALYVLMIVMSTLGWLMLSAAGKPIPLFGFQLPALLACGFGATHSEGHTVSACGRTGQPVC